MKKTVLVVDDTASVRESLKKVLHEAGYEVLLAADGQEALERFDPQRVDLLLLDLGLPYQSGWEVFERVTRKNPVLPIIIITGQSDQYDFAAAAGVGAYMEKPLDALQLLRTIEELLAESTETRLKRLSGYRTDVRHIPADRELKARESEPGDWDTGPRGAFGDFQRSIKPRPRRREST